MWLNYCTHKLKIQTNRSPGRSGRGFFMPSLPRRLLYPQFFILRPLHAVFIFAVCLHSLRAKTHCAAGNDLILPVCVFSLALQTVKTDRRPAAPRRTITPSTGGRTSRAKNGPLFPAPAALILTYAIGVFALIFSFCAIPAWIFAIRVCLLALSAPSTPTTSCVSATFFCFFVDFCKEMCYPCTSERRFSERKGPIIYL